MTFWVYMVRCSDGTYYTGIAADVARRICQHNGELPRGARYTSARRPVTLVYKKEIGSRSEALKTEIRIKRLPRAAKDQLVLGAAVLEAMVAQIAEA